MPSRARCIDTLPDNTPTKEVGLQRLNRGAPQCCHEGYGEGESNLESPAETNKPVMLTGLFVFTGFGTLTLSSAWLGIAADRYLLHTLRGWLALFTIKG